MKDKINQKIYGNQNNVIGSNGNINIHRSPVSVKSTEVFQNSDVEPQNVEDEIKYYLENGWEFIGQTPLVGHTIRRGKKMQLIRLTFRKQV